MTLISKAKLIKIIINDCRELRKCVDSLYNREIEALLILRIDKVYKLHYPIGREARLHLVDIMTNCINKVIDFKEVKIKLRELIK